MAKRRKFRASEYGHIDCPNCGECDDRNLGMNRCGLCESQFAVESYGTNTVWSRVDGVLTRIDRHSLSSPERKTP